MKFSVCFCVLALIPAVAIAQLIDLPTTPDPATDLSAYRIAHPTKLTQHGPPPKVWQDPTPLKLPPNTQEITFDSGNLKLKAWMSNIPAGGPHPAVVFCHGGFWFGNEDWDFIKPFIDAGFVVLLPRVRGENGNPGEFEYYYGEVDDAIAAGQFLAAQPGVDKSRVFISGHSAGGSLATLAAMKDNPFALSAPISPTIDMALGLRINSPRQKALIVFNPADEAEVKPRNPMAFVPSLRTPIAVFYGDQEAWGLLQKRFVALARAAGRSASINEVPGDHGQALPNSVPKIVELFKNYTPQKPLADSLPEDKWVEQRLANSDFVFNRRSSWKSLPDAAAKAKLNYEMNLLGSRLSVMTGPMSVGETLATMARDMPALLKRQNPNSNVAILTNEDVQVAETAGVHVVYEMNNPDGDRIRVGQWFTVKGRQVYLITFGTDSIIYDAVAPEADEVIRTVRWSTGK